MANGRLTWADLAALLGLSAPATADRVRQLEASGVIQQFAAILNAEALDLALAAFIFVTLERPHHRDGFLTLVQQQPEIQECHHITGDDDYLLKVRCKSTGHLNWLLNERLKRVDGVLRTRTLIALSSTKDTTALPLPHHIEYEGG